MKILVIHDAGMNMRGKVQQEIFGTMTLAQYEEHIQSYAKDLGMQVQFLRCTASASTAITWRSKASSMA